VTALGLTLDTAEVEAGGVLTGRVELAAGGGGASLDLELSLLWHTEGKGRRDEGRCTISLPIGPDVRGGVVPFSVTLPTRPWSYDGRLLKIRWEVWVQARGRALVRSALLPLTLRSPFATRALVSPSPR